MTASAEVAAPGGGAGEGRGAPGERRGRVSEFDETVGLGVIEPADPPAGGLGPSGGYPFHCTQIAGGSRRIEVGTDVTFTLVAGRLGRWEAVAVTPAGPGR